MDKGLWEREKYFLEDKKREHVSFLLLPGLHLSPQIPTFTQSCQAMSEAAAAL